MKHKFFSMACAVAATGALFFATPMTPPAFAKAQHEITQREAVEAIIQFCASSFTEYRRYGTTKRLDQGVANLSPDERLTVYNMCRSYIQGYQDGLKYSRIS